jgi:hypothetical protein
VERASGLDDGVHQVPEFSFFEEFPLHTASVYDFIAKEIRIILE